MMLLSGSSVMSLVVVESKTWNSGSRNVQADTSAQAGLWHSFLHVHAGSIKSLCDQDRKSVV